MKREKLKRREEETTIIFTDGSLPLAVSFLSAVAHSSPAIDVGVLFSRCLFHYQALSGREAGLAPSPEELGLAWLGTWLGLALGSWLWLGF